MEKKNFTTFPLDHFPPSAPGYLSHSLERSFESMRDRVRTGRLGAKEALLMMEFNYLVNWTWHPDPPLNSPVRHRRREARR